MTAYKSFVVMLLYTLISAACSQSENGQSKAILCDFEGFILNADLSKELCEYIDSHAQHIKGRHIAIQFLEIEGGSELTLSLKEDPGVRRPGSTHGRVGSYIYEERLPIIIWDDDSLPFANKWYNLEKLRDITFASESCDSWLYERKVLPYRRFTIHNETLTTMIVSDTLYLQ